MKQLMTRQIVIKKITIWDSAPVWPMSSLTGGMAGGGVHVGPPGLRGVHTTPADPVPSDRPPLPRSTHHRQLGKAR